MLADAGEDALAHAADDARSVARGLVHAELDVLAAEEQRAAAEQHRRGLCCDAGAGAAFREDQRDGLVEERLGRHAQARALAARVRRLRGEPRRGDLLEVVGMRDGAGDLGTGKVGEGHQVGDGGHRECVRARRRGQRQAGFELFRGFDSTRQVGIFRSAGWHASSLNRVMTRPLHVSSSSKIERCAHII